jgi:uncharacterized repeat protein (TIGR03803 family)
MTASTAQPQRLIPVSHSKRRRAVHGVPLVAMVSAVLLAATPFAHAQTFTILHEFTGSGDGAQPTSGVLVDPSGNLFGTTFYGGAFDYGTVFRLDSTGKETLLHSFLGGEGLWPDGGLIEDTAGNLYGTASDGGAYEGGGCAHGCGVVFKRNTSGTQTLLHAFTGKTDGGTPDATLIQDPSGNLYGTTSEGGDVSCFFGTGCGVIFKLDTLNRLTVLYRFTDREDGQFPVGVVADAAGNLYGTTYSGGKFGHGDVFKLTPTATFSILYSFTGGSDSGDPKGPLIIDQAGNLYGTTYGVNTSDFGIVYKLSPSGTITVLYTFTGGSNGSYPGGLVMDQTGNLYGATLAGGTGTGCYYGSCGTVFKIASSGSFTVLHSFSLTDGQLPNALTIGKSGNLYGTTLGGGKGSSVCSYYKGCGVVFKLTP